ncbi:MAG: proline--tRNA ligase [Clostridiales bacterium]|nr:proline--tRNA ligase [Clostridiales bacterium]
MKLTNMFFKTFRENPANAEINSHKLLVRAGFIKQMGNGIFMYLPMGLRVLEKLKKIIREEMNRAGAIELQMPILLPQEVYANRLNTFGNTMYKLKDSTGKDFCLGPTHEEPFTYLVKENIKSYKQLPVTLYQIQNKYRDEIRARFGLQRAKEFIMKDAYSFDTSYEGLDVSFDKMKDAYNAVFKRLGFDFVAVEADNGVMGGSGSTEFMVKADIGEDEIIVCDCGYGANTEKAECNFIPVDNSNVTRNKMEMVKTPSVKTIEELVEFLNLKSENFVKAVVYSTDKGVVLALCRGDREIEEVKLQNTVGAINIEMATAEQIESIGSVAGFVGAVGLKNVTVVADNDIKNMVNFVIGANKTDYHYINANLEDIHVDIFADIKSARAGDVCPRCGGIVKTVRGIEVGHIFKLGTRYTEALDCKYLDENGKEQYMIMGCYGIGVSRTLSALVEQNCDDKGMCLPECVAPYKLDIVIANKKDETQNALANEIYSKVIGSDDEVLLDDRNESFGVKLKDAELIGVPYILIVGKGAQDGKVELIERKSGNRTEMTVEEFIKNYK